MQQKRKPAEQIHSMIPIFSLVLLGALLYGPTQAQSGRLPGVYLVRLVEGVRAEVVTQSLTANQSLERVSTAVTDAKLGGQIWERYYRFVSTDTSLTAEQLRTRLGPANVEVVEPEYWLEFFDVPTDSLFTNQWYLHNSGQEYLGIDRKPGTNNDKLILKTGVAGMDLGRYPLYGSAPAASTRVVVADIDTGVDPTHPELQGQFWSNPDEIPRNGIDDDRNGYVDDTLGYDVSGNTSSITNIVGDNDPSDISGHGTHIAGIIAAAANGRGIVGVAPEACIMAVKIRPNATTAVGAAGIVYAVNAGAQIINISWGTPYESVILSDAVEFARINGVMVVVAAGNTGDNTRWYPAAIPSVFTVGAGDSRGFMTSFSTFGAHIDIVAPGLDILSLRAAGTDMYAAAGEPGVRIIGADSLYYLSDGTSMAAPTVCGAAALVLGIRPDLSISRLESVLKAGATDMIDPRDDSSYLPGPDTISGSGYLNIARSLDLLQDGGISIVSPTKQSRHGSATQVRLAAIHGYAGYWKLEYSTAAAPETWLPLAEGAALPVDSLATVFEKPELAGHVTLRVTDALGNYSTVTFTYVPNRQLLIVAPTSGQEFNFHIPIYITAYGPDIDSTTLSYFTASSTQSTLMQSTGEYFDSLAFSWEASGLDSGDYDIVLTGYYGAETLADTVVVHINSAFASGWPQPLTGRGCLSPVVADLDHDGVKEIIVGTVQGINVFHGDGSPVTGFPTLFDLDCRGVAAIYDVDHDGLDEILVATDATIEAIKYDGSSAAGWPIMREMGSSGLGNATVSVGRLSPTADSVVMCMDGSGNVCAYQFNGQPYFYSLEGWFAAINPYETPSYFWGGNNVVSADLNGDGYNEVIASYSSLIPRGGVGIYDSRTGQPAFKAASPIQIEASGVYGTVLVDLTQDQLPEIVTTGYDSLGVRTIWAKTLGRFAVPGFPIQLPEVGGWRGNYPTAADLDGDGSPEVICSFFEYDVGVVYIFRADGSPYVVKGGRPFGEAIRVGVTLSSPIAADLTGDGRPELIMRSGYILPGTGTEKIFIFDHQMNLLPGWPVATPAETRGVFSTPYTPLVDDMDGDGLVELVLVSESGVVYVWNFNAPSHGGKNAARLFMDTRNSLQYVDPAIPTDTPDPGDALPAAFALEQNYPNPFNPTTAISFSVPRRTMVKLDVFNILGQQVKCLVNEERSAGSYTVTLDGSSIASGVYFYQLQAGSYTSARKMVLVK